MLIQHAETDEQIARCHDVMRELRPHLDKTAFVEQVIRQRPGERYRLAFLEDNGEIVAAAGYRLIEMLAWGRPIYVDDLVTLEARRGRRYGSRMIGWLIEEAKRLTCDQSHLDSGVQRFGARRFHLHKGMDITSHHFALRIRRT